MSNYILSCCSTADLSKAHFDERDIHYTCFHYELDGTNYLDDLGVTIPLADFYKAMEDGADTRTSQINIDEYVSYFKPFLEEGKDILHLTLSGGLSGSINSAHNAAKMLQEEFPDRKIFIVDSLAASSGYGLLMDKLADLRDEGMGVEELAQWAETNKTKLQHWFFTTTLKYFVRGGRVSKTAGFFGGILNICPLLHVDKEGKLIPMEKIRTKKKVVEAIVKKMEAIADNGLDYCEKVFISNSACTEDAKEVADLVTAKFPKMKGKVEIFDIGTVIGSHTGPGTVALFFWGADRMAE